MSNFKPACYSGTTKSLFLDSSKNRNWIVIVDDEFDKLEVMKRSLDPL
jgi:hypothetical protein